MARPINREKVKETLKSILMDDEDRWIVADGNWYISSNGYLICSTLLVKKQPYVFHRIAMNAPKGIFVDHINGNKLDNRKANLRMVTNTQNQMNKKKYGESVSSVFRGVHFRKNRGTWVATINDGNGQKCVGSSKYEKIAALLYDSAVRKYYGEYGTLNYPLSYERSSI